MSLVTFEQKHVCITFDNYKEYIGKKVEVQIGCRQFGLVYPDNNTFLGMNQGAYYFCGDYGSDDPQYWHFQLSDTDECSIDVFHYYLQGTHTTEYKTFFTESIPYNNIKKFHPEYFEFNNFNKFGIDLETLAIIQKLKSENEGLHNHLINGDLRKLETDISIEVNKIIIDEKNFKNDKK